MSAVAPRRLPGRVYLLSLIGLLSATADLFVIFFVFWVAGLQGWSGVQTAVVVIVTRVPSLLGGWLGGAAVDRFGPIRMIGVDVAIRVASAAGLAVVAWNGELPPVAVMILGGIAAASAPITYASARTLIPRMVDRAALPRANALLAVGDQLPLIISAALISPAVELLGVGPSFLVPVALLAVVVVLVASVRRWPTAAVAPHPHETDGAPARPWWRIPSVLALVVLSVLYYGAYGPFETVLPSFVRDDMGSGSATYSAMWVAFGLGALVTLPLAPMLARRRPGVVNALNAVAWGLVTLPVVFATGPVAGIVVFFLSGAVWGPYTAIETTALHRWAPPSTHGRLFGTLRALLQTATPVGAALGSIAHEAFPVGPILAVSALGCVVAGLTALALPAVRRRLEDPETAVAPRSAAERS
ncbi:MFS transporter [Herbiconiux sp. L3-i23]|uniref:MFS transporter n=1 Tax=Herbiconiux sp. L3-i23 TaxID=2905871 RepID=UPI002073740E|nr:MFS transporter [Herbiconiux sp. L3-i23]